MAIKFVHVFFGAALVCTASGCKNRPGASSKSFSLESEALGADFSDRVETKAFSCTKAGSQEVYEVEYSRLKSPSGLSEGMEMAWKDLIKVACLRKADGTSGNLGGLRLRGAAVDLNSATLSGSSITALTDRGMVGFVLSGNLQIQPANFPPQVKLYKIEGTSTTQFDCAPPSSGGSDFGNQGGGPQ